MPELPEVETVVRELNKKISGRKLKQVEIFDKKIKQLRLPLPMKILSADRHGKYIVLHSTKGKILLHLRMSGRLKFAEKVQEAPEKYERARFYFNRGFALQFLDQRRFGTIEWTKGLPKMGLNPLNKEFSAENFRELVRSRSRGIKTLIMDQKLIGGMGNIYADESLWFAKINPLRKSDSLSDKEILRLRQSIIRVLHAAIKKGGSTMRDYKKTGGESGSYQLFRKVYKREGLPCFRCGKKIVKIKSGGRGTHFCPVCQK